MLPGLNFRLFRKDDLPGLLDLWQKATPWGSVTPETWEKWFLKTPRGECRILVGETAAGRIEAQLVLAPTRLTIEGEEVDAMRISAPILAANLRSGPLLRVEHPIVGLLRMAVETARLAGARVLYALPQHTWLHFFRWIGEQGLGEFSIGEYRCLAAPFGQIQSATSRQTLEVERTKGFGRRHEVLWQAARDGFPIECGVVRDRKWLEWKNNDHFTVEVSDGQGLLGYAAVRRSDGLLCDVLARDTAALLPLLAATLEKAGEEQPAFDEGVGALKVLETDPLRPALERLRFSVEDYRFALICQVLDAGLPLRRISADRWYVTAGD